MKTVMAIAAIGMLVALGQPAWAQSQNNPPGAGGVSKPGTPGAPGGKSGPAAKPSGAAGADESGVKGMPGNKSGPSVREPKK
jgi:hypothetical protein